MNRHPEGQLRSGSPRAAAFSLIELLVVIAIIGILAALLLPALATVQAKGKRAVCLDNLKQSALSFQMYTADNDGKLAQNVPLPDPSSDAWVLGNMTIRRDATNTTLIRQGKFFPYASQVALYRCPADPSRTGDSPRVRSYAMNGWIGSRYMENSTYTYGKGYRTFVRDSELVAAGPSKLWVIGDEHELSIDDAWFLVTMDDSRPFASSPASRHENSYGLNFADGHAAFFKLYTPEARTFGSSVTRNNPDWLRLKEVTTVR